jgi:site-specific DNA-methyltransferase (adenine-specific)
VTQIRNGVWWQGDCLEVMKRIPDGSVDMILCDLPYGTTQNKWDNVIPFEPLWREYWRVAKPRAAVVLTASQPFTSALVMSQVDNFKYDWTWNKVQPTGHLNAKRMPMRTCESVAVFYREQCVYNPQLGVGAEIKRTKSTGAQTTNYGDFESLGKNSDKTRQPTTLLTISSGKSPHNRTIHPTQKPVALFEYLIRTYTNPGDVVLDNCAGSGTTAIACENTGRHWVCIEQDAEYSRKAIERIRAI